jgi:hypothetical protein
LLETTASDHTSQQMTCNIIAAAFYWTIILLMFLDCSYLANDTLILWHF